MNLFQLRASLRLWRYRYAWRDRRLSYWKRKRNNQYIGKWTKLREEAKGRIHLRLKQIEEIVNRKPVAMFDSVTLSVIPTNAEAVAGYTSGSWPTYNEVVRRWPHAKHLSIAVNASHDADCLDIETGDATPAEAPGWVHRQKRLGKQRPCLYANASTMPAVKSAIAREGIKRGDVRLWVADWTFRPHVPPGYDACQWTDKALGLNLDESLCNPGFFV